jgi:hypothetical protein
MPRFKLQPPRVSEHELQGQILDYLAMELAKKRVAWYCRVNSGAVKAGPRFIRFYLLHLLGKVPSAKGKADIEGMLMDGRYFALEVKKPGEEATEEQAAFMAVVNAGGGIAAVCRNFTDARAVLFPDESEP